MSQKTWATVALIFVAIPWTLVFAGAVYEYRQYKKRHRR